MRATNHDHLILALSAIMSAANEIVEDAFFMGKCRWCEETDLHDPRCPVTRLNRGLRAAHNVEIEFEEPAIEDRSKAVSTEVGKIINRLIEARPSRFSVTLPDKTLIEYVNLDTVPVTLETTEDESAATKHRYYTFPRTVIHALNDAAEKCGVDSVGVYVDVQPRLFFLDRVADLTTQVFTRTGAMVDFTKIMTSTDVLQPMSGFVIEYSKASPFVIIFKMAQGETEGQS